MPDTIHLFISVKIPYILYSAVDFVCWEYSPFSFFNIRVCFPLFCLICIFMLRFSFCPLSYGANPCSAFLMNPSYPPLLAIRCPGVCSGAYSKYQSQVRDRFTCPTRHFLLLPLLINVIEHFNFMYIIISIICCYFCF